MRGVRVVEIGLYEKIPVLEFAAVMESAWQHDAFELLGCSAAHYRLLCNGGIWIFGGGGFLVGADGGGYI